MRRFVRVGLLVCALGSGAAAQTPIRGFPKAQAAEQQRREEQLRAVPNADSLRARMRLLSEHPHEAGTERSRAVAEQILARFKSFGLAARIERFEALMPRPVERRLELLAPEPYTAKLQEPRLAEDKDSGDPDQLPTFNAYSPDGDVTAEVVFVNYGVPDDYRVLDSLGISVRGKIVIAKYGRSWRGIKPKVAAERGAVGAIIYSDPRDDGYFVGDVYPKGSMRPWFGVQRGSVMDMPTYPGDPLSPGWASEAGGRKLSLNEVRTLEPIPVLPISYEDALPILRNLGGAVVPDAWKGALPITYHFGPGPARVHLALKFDWQTRPLYNVIARVPGATDPDQWIVYGNHHDPSVNGAEDPISGMVALEETARSVAALLKTGWRPARTLIFAAWDGEEWGLLGSTEWAEKHRDVLKRNAVLYLNSDTNGRGFIFAAGSHSLQTFVSEIARDVQDPRKNQSVLDVWLARRRAGQPLQSVPVVPRRDTTNATPPAERTADAPQRPDVSFTIDALGSGSDYTAFIDHLGLTSLHVSYGGEGSAGIYHSIYDTYDFYSRFLDTTFVYGVTEARTTGTLMLRLADAVVLPFEFGNVARTYRKYVDEIEAEARKKDEVKALDLSAVRRALDQLDDNAQRFEQTQSAVLSLPPARLRSARATLSAANRILYQAEQALTDDAGLPERSWFKHLIYAPGFYTGYGVKTMPGIREAVEDRPNLHVATREAARVAAAIEQYAARVAAATARLSSLTN
ncbi:MAG TPA: transferrin receptor-like dimerization domain-containing protein [Longimicrobiales bacterium]|nr:transferrin receptor-like dimerization domain-containing protein [Longimicrobiales bacterium]